ncbi:hypothetical protein LTR95_004818 [Oleoguttula sp. CCFEE 5521]
MPPPVSSRTPPPRKDARIIIHFDYDCFYAAVFEAANPNLKSLPFAVQQKQIIVTCNYEARRRGLHKLQLIREARQICPEVIIELGEDISRFRDASKELYKFIEGFSWNGKVERLGFDEVWLDVTDMIDFNMEILNVHDLANSFFQMHEADPTAGFGFDAGGVAGHAYPEDYIFPSEQDVDQLTLRLRLGSHLAMHIRHELEREKGYTCTVGIATNKVLSKLVGNLHKPKGQTVLMPDGQGDLEGPSQAFIGEHDIGKVPGIGFKLSQKIRECILQRPAEFDAGLVYGGTKEKITVADVRENPSVNSEMLEKLLAGPGSPHGIGYKIWSLLHGVDDTEVSQMRTVPRQISIEDSYVRLDTMPELLKELDGLAKSLLTRMRIDLLGVEDDWDEDNSASIAPLLKKWLAHPKTLRLTTRPRKALLADGTRPRSFKRISHSAPLPTFVFSLSDTIDVLADKLVKEALAGMFRKLHPEKAGWNLSLVNLAVTNMAETGGESKTANGRDISGMFRRQEDVLKDFRIVEDAAEEVDDIDAVREIGSAVSIATTDDVWDDGEEDGSEHIDATTSSTLDNFTSPITQYYHSTIVIPTQSRMFNTRRGIFKVVFHATYGETEAIKLVVDKQAMYSPLS